MTLLASTGPDVASSSIFRKDVSTFWLQDPQRSVEFGQLTRPVSEGISQALAALSVILRSGIRVTLAVVKPDHVVRGVLRS